MKKYLLAFIVLASSPTLAQPVQQSGTVTPGHPLQWVTNGVAKDAGPASNGTLTGVGVQSSGLGYCQNSGPLSGTYTSLCSGFVGGVPTIAVGGTSGQNVINFNLNGSIYPFPGNGNGNVIGPTSTTPNDLVLWNNSSGTLVKDGGRDLSTFVTTTPGTSFTPTLVAQLNSSANVENYGAKCDGASHPLSTIYSSLGAAQAVYSFVTSLNQENDWAAIQLAANKVNAVGGGTVLLPGNCMVQNALGANAPIVVSNSTDIVGTSEYGTGVKASPQTTDVFDVNGANNEFSKFSINVSGSLNGSEVYGISDAMNPFGGTHIHNVTMNNVYSGVYNAGPQFYADQTNIYMASGNTVGRGFVFNAGSTSEVHVVTGSLTFGGSRGFSITGAGSTFTFGNDNFLAANVDCAVEPNGVHGNVYSVKFLPGVYCDSATGTGALFDGTNAIIFRTSIVQGWFSSAVNDGIVIKGTVRGFSDVGSELYHNGSNGYNIQSTAVLSGLSISSDNISGNSGAGIYVSANLSGISITNNNIKPWADFGSNNYPVFIATGSGDYLTITGNQMQGNTNSMSNGATGSHTAIANNLD